jgi:hypothetical protein
LHELPRFFSAAFGTGLVEALFLNCYQSDSRFRRKNMRVSDLSHRALKFVIACSRLCEMRLAQRVNTGDGMTVPH